MSQAPLAPEVESRDIYDAGTPERASSLEVVRLASYRRLVYLRFLKNRLAVASLILLTVTYSITLAAEFFAPYDPHRRFNKAISAPPQLPRFLDATGQLHLIPFVYAQRLERDLTTLGRVYVLEPETRYPLRLFVHGDEYKFLGFQCDLHFFGAPGVDFFLAGTDTQGRDLLSRLIHGGRISTTVGLIGVALSLIFGFVMGMVSGYFGGRLDQIIQRGIEVLLSFPSIPLWLALSAAVPRHWNPVRIFFLITVILSFIGWGGLARVVRGMVLSLKNEGYVLAARMSGGGALWIIRRHLLLGVFSHAIVSATLRVPGMILAETALSFLGLGIRPPAVSWGTLLRDAQDVTVIDQFPWLLTPVLCVMGAVLAFNFVGDGLRDAIDPFSRH